MSAQAIEVVLTPTNAVRPGWISELEWQRMPWPARIRAARRALRVVPTMTDDGADPTHGWLGGTSAPVATPAAPSSPDPGPVYPCALGCGRNTTLVYCQPCADLHTTAPVLPPPRWLTEAWANRHVLDRLARLHRHHIQHPRRGGYRNSPRPYRSVTP